MLVTNSIIVYTVYKIFAVGGIGSWELMESWKVNYINIFIAHLVVPKFPKSVV